jgi:hypothetical protein
VKFELVALEELDGSKTKIYSVLVEEAEETLFDRFIAENYAQHPEEVQNIYDRLVVIASETGLREGQYKPNEGKPGDGICALYDTPNSHLRLYFIGFGNLAIILGSGGHKPKHIRALQEDETLKKENYLLRRIAAVLMQAIQEKTLQLTDEGFTSSTNFIYTDDNE